MEDQFSFPKESEHSIQIENVSIRMLTSHPNTGRARRDGAYPRHAHAHAELFACLSGFFHLQTAGGVLTVGAGDLVIVPPHYPHYKLPCAKETVWYNLGFSCTARRRSGGSDLMRRLSILHDPEHLLLARGVDTLCKDIARVVRCEANSAQLPALRLAAVLNELCDLELQKIGRGKLPTPPAPTEENRDLNRLSRLDYLINTCYMDSELSVARAAERLFISERQLERIMQKEYGYSFRRKICERRLEVAAQMLCEDTLSVERICAAVGFANRNALTRAFRQKYGITPSHFRKEQAKRDRIGEI